MGAGLGVCDMILFMNSKQTRSEADANWSLQPVETPSWQRPSVQRNRAKILGKHWLIRLVEFFWR